VHILIIQKDFTMAKTYDLPLIPLEYVLSNPRGNSIEKTTKSRLLRFSLLKLI
jgi:hypothetical protein